MKSSLPAPRIVLVVVNPGALRQGCAPTCSFDPRGGTIGCRDAGWILADNRERIQPLHCEIVLDEGVFCIVDRCGHTFLNGCDAPLGRNVSARLAEGDTLRIGPYRICAYLHEQHHELPDPSRHLIQYGVGELLNLGDEKLDFIDHLPVLTATEPERPAATDKERLSAWLEGAQTRASTRDPLVALNAGQMPEDAGYSLIDATHHGMTPATTQADLADTRFEAISGRPVMRCADVHPLRPPQEPVLLSLLDVVEQPAAQTPDDAAITDILGIGLEAAQQPPSSRSGLNARFREAFAQTRGPAPRTQRKKAQ